MVGHWRSQTEWDPTADLGYYIRQSDDGPWHSRRKRNLAIAKTGSMAPRALHRQEKLAAKEKSQGTKADVPDQMPKAQAEPVSEATA